MKKKYYMEFWELGDTNRNIIAQTFHSAYIDAFIKHFIECKKYSIVHLELLEPVRKVLYSKRLVQHANAA